MAATQIEFPRKALVRTAFQALVGLIVLVPVIIAETGLTVEQLPWLAPVVAVAAFVSRLMAIPAVNDFLTKFGLGATPAGSEIDPLDPGADYPEDVIEDEFVFEDDEPF